MIAFDPTELSSTDINDLKPGQLFYYTTNATSFLAVALTPIDEIPMWLTLSGELRFVVGTLDQPPSPMCVLPLPISPDALRIRADFSCQDFNYDEHTIGQLIFGEAGKAGITASGIGHDPTSDRTIVECDKWDLANEDQPRFLISRWTLSYLEADQWVDVFTSDIEQTTTTSEQQPEMA